MRPALIALTSLLLASALPAQTRRFALDSAGGLRMHNVKAEPATLDGKRGLRVTGVAPDSEQLAIIDGLEFANGVIEAEIAGALAPDAGAAARGFVGIAFRVQSDMRTYDAFYLRPTNGRAEDQERRNHATQYISHPGWTWSRLRQETPSKYESYVDLLPNVWTKIKIEVRGDRARLYVNDNPQPALIVNDVKSGPTARGTIALWVGPGTIAHFRNLTVTNATP
jgi:hypothetical protein